MKLFDRAEFDLQYFLNVRLNLGKYRALKRLATTPAITIDKIYIEKSLKKICKKAH